MTCKGKASLEEWPAWKVSAAMRGGDARNTALLGVQRAGDNVVTEGFQGSGTAWGKGLAGARSSRCRRNWSQCRASWANSPPGGQGQAKRGTEGRALATRAQVNSQLEAAQKAWLKQTRQPRQQDTAGPDSAERFSTQLAAGQRSSKPSEWACTMQPPQGWRYSPGFKAICCTVVGCALGPGAGLLQALQGMGGFRSPTRHRAGGSGPRGREPRHSPGAAVWLQVPPRSGPAWGCSIATCAFSILKAASP